MPATLDSDELDWASIRRRAEFCICVATLEGQRVSERLAGQVAAARRVGLEVGLSLAFSEISPESQLSLFRRAAETCDYGPGDVAPIVVVENVGSLGASSNLQRLVQALRDAFGDCVLSLSHLTWQALGAPGWVLEGPLMTPHIQRPQPAQQLGDRPWRLERYEPQPPLPSDALQGLRVLPPLPLVTSVGWAAKSSVPVDLFFGDAREPSLTAMEWSLFAVLTVATAHSAAAEQREGFNVPFAAVVRALFQAHGPWSDWLRQRAPLVGAGAFAPTGPVPEQMSRTALPIRLTTSSTRLLKVAQSYAGDRLVGVEELLGAVIFDSVGHEDELEDNGFSRVAWGNAFVDETESRGSRHAEHWRALRERTFPAAGLDDIDWDRLGASTKACLEWAAAAAALESPRVPAGPRHVLAAKLLKGLTDEQLGALRAALNPRPDEPSQERARWAHRLNVVAPEGMFPSGVASLKLTNVLCAALRACLLNPGTQEDYQLLAALMTPSSGERAALDPILDAADIDAERLLDAMLGNPSLMTADEVRVLAAVSRRRRGLSRWDRPDFDLDHVSGTIAGDRDKLNVRRPAERFAKLLAASEIDPPIALGLFGRWGTGKSTFMGLMKGKIKEIEGKRGYVKRVVAIDFNAWHYQDTNLWASIALRIYEALAEALAESAEPKPDAAKPTPEAIRRELTTQVRSNQQLKEQAEAERARALSVRAENVSKLEIETTRREQRRRQRMLLPLDAAFQALRAELAGAKADPDLLALEQAAQTVESKLGIPALLTGVEDLERLERDTRATFAQARGLGVALERQFVGPNSRVAGAAIVALLGGLVVLMGWGVLSAKAWASKHGVEWVATELSEEVQEAEKQLRQSEQELQRLDGEIRQADVVIREATAEIDRIEKGGLVYDFVRERAASERYTSHVGLVSTLRDDLKQLRSLLAGFKDTGPAIERIVLYIDDLDRCQPEQVVDVLQAVHLLLAFPLFHVVVGVDPRWLSRSLRRRYVQDDADATAFDPHEYLEKIFQIPYTLPEMTEAGFKQLVGSLVQTRSEAKLLRTALAPKPEPAAEPEVEPPAAPPTHGAAPPPAAQPPKSSATAAPKPRPQQQTPPNSASPATPPRACSWRTSKSSFCSRSMSSWTARG